MCSSLIFLKYFNDVLNDLNRSYQHSFLLHSTSGAINHCLEPLWNRGDSIRVDVNLDLNKYHTDLSVGFGTQGVVFKISLVMEICLAQFSEEVIELLYGITEDLCLFVVFDVSGFKHL